MNYDLIFILNKDSAIHRGETGIRTLGTVARSPHFECGPIDHSGISPFSLRREGDSNPRYAFDVYTLSRRASSATRASLLITRI